MKSILLVGAGKSATVLITYLLAEAQKEDWLVIVADANQKMAAEKIGDFPRGKAVAIDIKDAAARAAIINEADIVISMLPPTLHQLVATDCVRFSRNLLTASYVDDHLKDLQAEIEDKGLLFLCEMGLDPGIDHMSAMQIIDEIHTKHGKITSFKSHCGGLVAPESDDNPWHYKISWNPRNIVLAGKAGAHYRENGVEVSLPYEELFNTGKSVQVSPLGDYGLYANRDSLSYEAIYNLPNTNTFQRTTLRHPDFMIGWAFLIELDMTNETPQYETDGRSMAEIMREHGARQNIDLAALKTTNTFLYNQLEWLGFFDENFLVDKGYASLADILQFAVERRLKLSPNDRDMIVMLHEFEYVVGDINHSLKSSLIVKGEDSLRTAMAKTVGLPLGIATKLILTGNLKLKGLRIPTHQDIYMPVLAELKNHGIEFIES
jgi:saccharopine dehydrogenase-like NADP-dependent oxidoreductase